MFKRDQIGLKMDQKELKILFFDAKYLFFGGNFFGGIGVPPPPFADNIFGENVWRIKGVPST